MLTSILNGIVSLTSPSLYFRKNILHHHLTRRMYEHQSRFGHGGENMKSLLWPRIEPCSSNSKPDRHAVIFSPVHTLMWRHTNGMAAQAVTVLTWSWEIIGLHSSWGTDYPEFLLCLVWFILYYQTSALCLGQRDLRIEHSIEIRSVRLC